MPHTLLPAARLCFEKPTMVSTSRLIVGALQLAERAFARGHARPQHACQSRRRRHRHDRLVRIAESRRQRQAEPGGGALAVKCVAAGGQRDDGGDAEEPV